MTNHQGPPDLTDLPNAGSIWLGGSRRISIFDIFSAAEAGRYFLVPSLNGQNQVALNVRAFQSFSPDEQQRLLDSRST